MKQVAFQPYHWSRGHEIRDLGSPGVELKIIFSEVGSILKIKFLRIFSLSVPGFFFQIMLIIKY